ncbi:hypothetical protein DFJ74DRAFT_725027 [Hyaloraphidium curvatum]|nr:hypothetical protein DFJ74DRAFT_725027 [Hyaloraphidium curvatum]
MSLPVELVLPILRHLRGLPDDGGVRGHALHAPSLVSRTWAAAARDLLYANIAVATSPDSDLPAPERVSLDLGGQHGAAQAAKAEFDVSWRAGRRLALLARTLKEMRDAQERDTGPDTGLHVRSIDFSACRARPAAFSSAAADLPAFLVLAGEVLSHIDAGRLESISLPHLVSNRQPLHIDVDPRRFLRHWFSRFTGLLKVNFGTRAAGDDELDSGAFEAVSPSALQALAQAQSAAHGDAGPVLESIDGLSTVRVRHRIAPEPLDLRPFRNLLSLHVRDGPFSDQMLFEIASPGSCAELRHLRVSSGYCSVSPVGIEALGRGCPHLATLCVGSAGGSWTTPEGIHALASSPAGQSLRRLDLGAPGARIPGMIPRALVGMGPMDVRALSMLGRLRGLVVLDLSNQDAADAVVLPPVLAALPNLAALCLEGCHAAFRGNDAVRQFIHRGGYPVAIAAVISALPPGLVVLDLAAGTRPPSEQRPAFSFGPGYAPRPPGPAVYIGRSQPPEELLAQACPALRYLDPTLLLAAMHPTGGPSPSQRMGPGPGQLVSLDLGAGIGGLSVSGFPGATVSPRLSDAALTYGWQPAGPDEEMNALASMASAAGDALRDRRALLGRLAAALPRTRIFASPLDLAGVRAPGLVPPSLMAEVGAGAMPERVRARVGGVPRFEGMCATAGVLDAEGNV